jgi:hypothetical protein
MHNLVAFYGSVAQDAVLVNLPPVSDPLVTISANNRVIFPMDYRIGCLQVVGEAVQRARLNSPSFRLIALPEIYPLKVTAEQGTNPVLMLPSWQSMSIPRNDETGIDVSHGGAGANDVFAALWVTGQFVPAPSGPVYTMRATATLTLTAGTWVGGTLAFDQVLPYGRYTVVGMQATVGDAMYARLTFPGNVQFRPGVPVVEAVGSYVNPQQFRFGAFGSFGTFDSTAQPGIEVLGHTAGAEAGVYLLDLIKVG